MINRRYIQVLPQGKPINADELKCLINVFLFNLALTYLLLLVGSASPYVNLINQFVLKVFGQVQQPEFYILICQIKQPFYQLHIAELGMNYAAINWERWEITSLYFVA